MKSAREPNPVKKFRTKAPTLIKSMILNVDIPPDDDDDDDDEPDVLGFPHQSKPKRCMI